MKKVLLTALALLMSTFMYAKRDAAKIPGADPSKDVKTEAVLSAVKAPANTNSARTTKGDSELTYCTGEFSGSIDRSGYGFPFAESFENGLTAWGNIDADGDGHLWELAAGHEGMGAKSVSWESSYKGSDAARRDNAAQKENGRGSYDPNNWLVSPEITIPSTAGQEGTVQLSWYAKGGSSSYPEHYGVYVSTTGNQPADFTTQLYEGTSPASWTQLTVDINAYIGQTIRVAFRHYNSYDKWNFVIDDVEVYEYVEPAPVVCDSITTFPYFNDFEDFNTNHDCWIDIDNDGDGYGWFTDTQAYGTYGLGVDGSNCLVSQSYDNNVGSRNADNYLLSPEFELPAGNTVTLSWYEQSQDSGYPDWYEVMIAPNGSTEISDFVSIYSGVAAYPWTQRTANISAYAGTTVRVVFHHQSYDCYFLDIDNMSITTGELSVTVNPTDLGLRPNGAWMEPVTVEVGGGVYNVTGMDMDNDYFTFDGPRVPFTTPASYAVTTGDAAATGLVEGTLTFLYNDSKTAKQFTMKATAYNPTAGDVVETATVVSSPVNYTNTPTGIYHNYNLPGEASDGADAVYKLTFASDVMLDANVGAAAGGKVALYAEDFNGEGGPMATNAYEYNGPQIEPGAGDTFTEGFESGSIPTGWTTIDADGDGHNWTPASVLMAGYVIPFHSGADCITSESYSSTVGALTPDNYLVTPKVAITNGSTFSFWACAQDPDYAGEHYGVAISTTTATAGAFTTIAEWTMTAKEAAGAGAYMSKNGKGTREGSWYQKTVDLSAYAGQQIYIAIRHFNCSDWFYLNVDDAELAIASKGEIARGGDSSFTEGFENGLNGWTNIDADGDGHVWMDCMDYGCYAVDYAHTGSHSAVSASYDLCYDYVAFNANNYLVSPQKYTIAEGSKLSFWYDDAEVTWSTPDYFEVCVSTAGNTSASDFTAVWNNGPVKSNGAKDGRGTRSYGTWRQVEVDLSAYAGQEVYIAFHHQQYDGYDLWIDDVELKADEPAPGMFVPAGTYYLVAQATESFTTHINATAAPAPEQAVIINPTDGMTDVEVPVAARWKLGNYTTEMQVLVGSQYPPQDVLIDWTSNLTNSATINDLLPNTTYFIQVNERNNSGVTEGEIVGFTTSFEKPVATVATPYLYPGDAAFLSWEMDRSFRGYNVYADGVKVNEALITENEYAVEGLEYGPHTLNVTAVYDEGESAYSNDIEVEMTGFGHVAGAVYEQDGTTPIAGAAVSFIGTDAFGFDQTFTFTTANDGTFTGDIYEGSYASQAELEGYQVTPGNHVNMGYDQTVSGLVFNMYEEYLAVGQVYSEVTADNKANVWWSWAPATVIEDFEGGEMPEGWNQVGSYGWEITTNAPYEGTYCIKSSNAGIASSTGAIEVTVDVPYEAKMSFYVKPSSESNYDKFYFYIDGVEKFNTSGAGSWTKKEYTVAAGTHTYKWAYTKDSSVNSNDDCIYVDYVTLFEKTEPTPPVIGGTTYDFEDGFQGWTSLDADGDGYGWIQASTLVSGVAGHEGSADFVLSQSYDNNFGVLYPDNYLVSPTKLACQAGAQVKLWACGQDANYAAEHFGVAVSTGGATASEFTTVAEWTIGSKGGRAFKSADNKAAVRGTRDQSEWIEYTANLSAYAGQEVWVAIRHFNVSDMFYIDVDDITLATGGSKMETADNRSFASYNVYRKNVLTDEYSKITSTADTTYVDAQWSTLPACVYQYGVSATYEGNRGSRSELTVNDGTDNNQYIPVFGYCNDGMQENQFIIPASQIAAMNGSNITSMTFYLSEVGTSSWDNEWNITLMETSATTLSEVMNVTAGTTVTTTMLSGTSSSFTITFDAPFAYNGGNLLVDFESLYAGSWSTAKFYGVNTESNTSILYYYDAWQGMWITDPQQFLPKVTFAYEGGAPAPTGDGESEIVWADPMDKDMVATVDVSAVTNNGQSVAGAVVKFENMVEDLVYEETLDETGFVSFGDFRKGYYTMSVELPGYAANMGGEVEIFEDKTYNVTLTEVIAPAEGLFASATGWVMWDNIGGDIPTPPTPGDDTEFTEGFEGGLNGWNVLNVNAGEGAWLHSDDNLGGYDYATLAHGGTGFALCYSFVDYVGSFDTDSYLYTPQKYQIVNGSTLSFWADNANDSYPENFSVCVATADNPQDADFTQVWSGGAKGGNVEKAAVRHNAARYENWRHHTIDLSAYAGQEVYIAFHDVNYDMYEIWIDDVELTAGSKDRAAQYSIVMLDGVIAGQATGNWFQLDTDNLVEGQEYEVSVASVYASGMSEWRTTTFTYYSCENFKPGVKNLAGEVQGVNDVKLTWTLPGGGGAGDEFSFAFDNDLEGWTNIDGDGDGHVFYHSNEASNHGTMAVTSHSGAGHVMGESYCNASYAALTPNDFFVTPQQYNIGASSMLSFWACAQDVNYAAEHFGVAISTSGNTSASDFTTIAEWTLTAKEGAKGPRATDGSREGAWYEYTCDLSEYAGQAAWIAIRHFNCSDQFLMCLDDISMSNADKANRDDEYLQYCTETYDGAVGTGGGQVWWANAYTPAQLADYDGRTITHVGQWVSAPDMYGNIYDGTYNVEVYVGGSTSAPGTLVASASQYITGDNAWHDIELDTPVTIDATQHLWFVFNATGIGYPMCGSEYVGDPNSDILSLDGMVWEHAASGYGLAYTWMIRGLVSGDAPIEGDFLGAMIFRDGELITPEPLMAQQMVDENVPNGEHEYMARLAFGNAELGVLDTMWYAMSCPVFATVNVDVECTPVDELEATAEYNEDGTYGVNLEWICTGTGIQSYKVYRDGSYIGMTTTMSYYDERTNNPGEYTYGVVAVYDYCESEMVTVEVLVDAISEDNVIEGIYPNPTTGILNINATAMQQITVVNALGQVVMNQTVSGDQTSIDMSSFEAGVYMVSVTTENGTSVKRVSVIK
ncbi:MAG: choice-of-anchor J domain-containing protein [Bacteroidales bacterium]|nr:choice-of-anchor J domain-containing protein [Bacteroidales bacterium]